jgi:hypothetical protein
MYISLRGARATPGIKQNANPDHAPPIIRSERRKVLATKKRKKKLMFD